MTGVWCSLAARLLREQKVVGSNPATPMISQPFAWRGTFVDGLKGFEPFARINRKGDWQYSDMPRTTATRRL